MTSSISPPSWASATQREVVATAIQRINQTEDAIRDVENLEQWTILRQPLMRVLENSLIHIGSETMPNRNDNTSPEKRPDHRLSQSIVSKHTYGDLLIENVRFRSAIGWEINGTVFRPVGTEALPGVVCPTGSSSKLKPQYWSSAQLIARSGYVVFSYDPPGFVGERREHSDMFAHAPLGYLTGLLPRSFFVFDNAGAIDYLDSRSDVIHDCGYAVTGLSLGAQTTVNAAIHDRRIRFIAPVCGAMSHFDYLLSELYTVSCIDMLPDVLAAGLDGARKLSLCAPTPCLLIGGAMDEVFTPESTQNVYDLAAPIYSLYDAKKGLELFIDPDAGHTYSPAMVNEVVLRIDRYLKNVSPSKATTRYSYTADDVIHIPIDEMKAHPDTKLNVCSLNSKLALRLRKNREDHEATQPKNLGETLSNLLHVDTTHSRNVELSIIEKPVRSWVHDFTRTSIAGAGFDVPSVLIARAGTTNAPGMVCIDENGVWAGIAGNGYMSRAFRFLDRTESASEPVILSLDAAGFGTLKHQYSAYDATSWSDPDSTIAYLAIAAGTPIAGLRVRDALAGLEIMTRQPNVDPKKLIIAGIGEGAVTALFASAIHGGCARTVLVDPPLSFEEIAKSGDHTWQRCSFVYNILKFTDIPELVLQLPGDIRVIRPLDAYRNPVTEEDCAEAYGSLRREDDCANLRDTDGVRGHSKSEPVILFPREQNERDTMFVESILAPMDGARETDD